MFVKLQTRVLPEFVTQTTKASSRIASVVTITRELTATFKRLASTMVRVRTEQFVKNWRRKGNISARIVRSPLEDQTA